MANTVTLLLDRWQAGDAEVLNELIPATMEDLRILARAALRGKDQADLQTTELIHETYLKLVGLQQMEWQTRVQFFAMASKVMRHLLIDRLRRQRVAADYEEQVFQLALPMPEPVGTDAMLAIHDALEQLAVLDARKATVLELRLFAGLTHDEIASYFGVTAKTIKRDWQFARTWLYNRLKGLES